MPSKFLSRSGMNIALEQVKLHYKKCLLDSAFERYLTVTFLPSWTMEFGGFSSRARPFAGFTPAKALSRLDVLPD